MQDFETEEQQVEALKKWFQENAVSLFLGVGIGVSALFGWRYYLDHYNSHHIEASDIYQSVDKNIADKTAVDNVNESVEQLISDYADTPYAVLASLKKASHELENKDVDNASARLEWVSNNAGQAEMQHLAILRLARVLISQQKYDEADQLLQQQHPAAFNAQYDELLGDLYVATGDIDKARQAYDRSIEQAGINVDRWLTMKRRDLGEANDVVADTSEQLTQ